MTDTNLSEQRDSLRSALIKQNHHAHAGKNCLRVLLLDQASSTMEVARTYAATPHSEEFSLPLPELDASVLLVLARTQSSGRGRGGKVWLSPLDGGFYGTFLLAAPKTQPVAALALVAGLALAEMLSGKGIAVGLKWPNDILVRRPGGFRKLAGILCEQYPVLGVSHVAVGVGFNLQRSDDLTALDALSLEELGLSLTLSEFSVLLVEALLPMVRSYFSAGFRPLLARWEQFSLITQATVLFEMDGSSARGLALGVNWDGALLVELADGRKQAIYSGEVSLASPE